MKCALTNVDPEGAVYADPPAAAEGMRRLRLGVQGFLAGTTRLSTRDTIAVRNQYQLH